MAFDVANGNQSDKAVFGKRLKAFSQKWNIDGMLLADSALYSEENLAELGELRWITRVPFTLSEAQTLVTELPSEFFIDSERKGYRLSSVCSTYGSVNQHWVVVENQARLESDRKQIEKQVKKRYQQAEKQLRSQCKADFNCAEDALAHAQALETGWRYHCLSDIRVVEHLHYDQPGRPRKGATPTKVTYRITAKVLADEEAIAKANRKAGRFILATNVVEDEAVSAESILNDYKGQQAPERGFGMLKDPAMQN